MREEEEGNAPSLTTNFLASCVYDAENRKDLNKQSNKLVITIKERRNQLSLCKPLGAYSGCGGKKERSDHSAIKVRA